jgi:hypothetical protein
MHKSLILLCALALPAATGFAEDASSMGEEVRVEPKARLSAGVGYGGPLGASVAGEVVYGLGADVRDDGDRVKAVAGILFQVEGGSGGGKLSLGIGARARVESEGFRAPAGVGVKLSLARTWAEAGADEGRTFLGPEIDLSAKHVGVTLGVLFRVGGAPGQTAVFSWGLGLRL